MTTNRPSPSEERAAQLRALEATLLTPAVRRSKIELDRILADEFREFGASGRVYDKSDCIAALAGAGDDGAGDARRQVNFVQIDEFSARELGTDTVLVTYRLAIRTDDNPLARISHRSSIWVYRAGRWQLLFHQGTSVPDPMALEKTPR